MGDGSDDDECLRYGTPLDPYEEDEVPKKKSAFQDITEQYALDSNGKRRFHGAFTGGFSAGHWNTVALPEGWQPQTFKSSKSDRMQLKQKPEDFMDDEDRSEFGIAPREVQTTTEFSGNKRPKRKTFQEGPIPGVPVLQNILEPVHETAAIRILKSMGWRPGKGVGEQITRREKKANKKVYSCFVPEEFRKNLDSDQNKLADSDDSSEDENEYSELLFEPDDFEPFVIKPKDNAFGLGYVGLSRHSVLGAYHNDKSDDWSGSHLMMNDKGRKVSIRGQAFGVGALEEEDEDIYSREDLSGYDFALDNLPSTEKNKKEKPDPQKSSFKSILEGFISSSVEYKLAKTYPPPALPQNYVPKYAKVKKSRFSDAGEPSSVPIRDRGLGRHELSSKDRGNILGEKISQTIEPIIQDKPIVQDKLVIQDEPKVINVNKTLAEKLAAITSRNINFVSNDNNENDSEKVDIESKKEDQIESIKDSSIEPIKDKKFKPFMANTAKQSRYEEFVSNKEKNIVDSNILGKTDRLSEWERSREIYEFEQAYKLYKPLSGTMGEKFVSAEHDENTPLEITKTSMLYASKQKIEAARLGKFGSLTREVCEWVPDSLLCKRFNIEAPNNGGYVQQSIEKKSAKYSIFEYLESPIHNKASYLKEQTSIKLPEKRPIETDVKIKKVEDTIKTKEVEPKLPTKKRLTVAELFLQEKEKEMTKSPPDKPVKVSEPEKLEDKEDDVQETIKNFNKIDLYKAVFLSDSDSDSSETEQSKVETPKTFVDIQPKNILRNESPPKGIFANLNFDKMNSWRMHRMTDESKIETKPHIFVKDKVEKPRILSPVRNVKKDDAEETYGPRLPEKIITEVVDKNEVMEIDSSSDSSDWVETDKVKSKKSKHKKAKKSSKKKKHKHKHKSKHKK